MLKAHLKNESFSSHSVFQAAFSARAAWSGSTGIATVRFKQCQCLSEDGVTFATVQVIPHELSTGSLSAWTTGYTIVQPIGWSHLFLTQITSSGVGGMLDPIKILLLSLSPRLIHICMYEQHGDLACSLC